MSILDWIDFGKVSESEMIIFLLISMTMVFSGT